MEWLSKFFAYIVANWYGILLAAGTVITALEAIVRLTPTKNDDGFVQRIANVYNKIFALVPNVKRESQGGKMALGTHEKKPVKLTPTLAEKKD